MSKCNINYTSQYAYLSNGETTHISKYIQNINNYLDINISCSKGHQLLCVNGKKNRPHFRHKHSEDLGGNPISEWHLEWQGNFPNTEVEFKKTNDQQVKSRRADVLLNETSVIEFQHSLMSKAEVDNRINDYKIHNKDIIWVIDGNKHITVNELIYSKRVYLEFTSELWKFESFMSCEYIYIDIQDKIYKVVPKLIKSNMIDVSQPIIKSVFIDYTLNCKELLIDEQPLQCNLFIKQQGAGNGKTYGIIKMLESEECMHYKFFIYVSKQHSAVHVIYNEFKDQIQKGILTYLEIKEEPKLVNKKYIIKYRNLKTNTICQIIIGTVDSFMYAVGNKNHNEFDQFEGLVNSIIDDHIETTSCGSLNYGGINPKLYKETILIKDEEQDLTTSYAQAIIRIMRNRYIDAYIVGDKLQSISHENNAFTYLLDNQFPYINKVVYEYTNICRRFNHPKLINFVNKMVPFNKFNLPEIQINMSEPKETENPLIIFEGKTIYSSENSENKLNEEVDKIMKYYEEEVNDNNRLPEDFLVVTPFTQSNPLVDALQLAINIYWKNKNNDDEFKRYAIFHKSETGSSINLEESTYSTRIVSVHSSKGDGRKVVFVIGLNEFGLNRFSGISNNLIYNSLFHVAITRMKEKLYFRYINNGDDISNKIQKYLHDNDFENSDIKPNLTINDNVKYNDIKENCKTVENFKTFEETIFNQINLQKLEKNKEDDKKIIDTSHHNVRYASIVINLYLEIIKHENNTNSDTKRQLIAMLHGIIKQGITETKTWKSYNLLLNDKFIPILKMSDKGRDYKKYFEIIIQFSNNILDKLKIIVKGENITSLCPMECIILYYMLEASHNGSYTKFHISELYNVIDIYSKSFDNKINDHYTCLCNNCFTNNMLLNKKNSLEEYIHTHFEKINKTNNNYKQFCLSYPNISWLVDHTIEFNGNTNDFKINKQFQLIGYDNDNVIIAYIKPQFNELNYNQTLMDAIFDTYLVKNVKHGKNKNEPNNYTRFNGKRVICLVFSTDLDEPYYINWLDSNETDLIYQNSDNILDIIKQFMISKYILDCKMVYNFYKYWRKHCPENITKPLDIINYIIQEFNIVKNTNNTLTKQMPNFITELFNNIKFKIENCHDKKEQKMILKEYDNKDKFMEYLEQRITDSIFRYFNNKNNDGGTDSDSDAGFISDDE